jgi:LDH2 family malate/lactate/ureidoglycolate dehydrogenase
MPNVPAEKLIEIAKGLLVAAGASEEEAAVIARYNIGANLVGHDSHGIILIPQYIDRIKAGHIVPQAPWVITQETATTTVIDGNWGFGYASPIGRCATRSRKPKRKTSPPPRSSARAISAASPVIRCWRRPRA